MKNYLNSLTELLKDWKKSIPVIILTVARIIYGWGWLNAGIHKLGWLSDGKLNSEGFVKGMINALAGPEVARFDPLNLNSVFAWIAENVFLRMPAVTDVLVVTFEILIGVMFIIGFKLVWTALAAIFLNLQFMAAGSSNNFGYIITNLVYLKFAKYGEVIGLGGFLRSKKGEDLV